VLRHRVLPSYEAEAEGVRIDSVIDRLLDLVPLP
jgi:MoxR-like ATPase